ncbi:MAG: DUF2231 domain-containing protein [Cyclobacteriaceae bacterium]
MITAPHLHAMAIHFPIALLMAGFLSEVIALITKKQFFKEASLYLLVLGALGAIVAYVSGSSAGDGMTDGILQKPIGMHEEAALVTLVLAIIAALFRVALYLFGYQKTWTKWLSLLLVTALVGSVARTGYLGGELVFKHGAGIELALPDFGESLTE